MYHPVVNHIVPSTSRLRASYAARWPCTSHLMQHFFAPTWFARCSASATFSGVSLSVKQSGFAGFDGVSTADSGLAAPSFLSSSLSSSKGIY